MDIKEHPAIAKEKNTNSQLNLPPVSTFLSSVFLLTGIGLVLLPLLTLMEKKPKMQVV
jgi:hypothetical protein